MVKVRLIKGASFASKYISASRKNPEVTVSEAVAEKAVASGFFEYAGKAEEESCSPAADTEDEPQDMPFYDELIPADDEDVTIENMTLAQLKELASQMGISTKGLKTKASYIEAIEKSADALEE